MLCICSVCVVKWCTSWSDLDRMDIIMFIMCRNDLVVLAVAHGGMVRYG